MRFRTLKSWTDPKSLEGLVFFAQLLEELLFDYSLDTYKPSAMNTSTLCEEALSLIEDIENELIDESNLSHVIKEFVFNLRKDEISKSLLQLEVNTICIKLENEGGSMREKRIVLEIVYSQIKPTLYKKKAEELLKDAVQDGNEKNRIRSLTRNYISMLISTGYSTRFLYPSVRKLFHLSGTEIRSPDDINLFFDIVKGENQKYVAIFKASKIFDEIKDSCKEFGLKITKSLEGDYVKYAVKKNFSINNNQVYIIIDELEEKDVFSARRDAEGTIEMISTLTSLFHHKEVPSWESNALMINIGSNTPRLVNAALNPMLLCSDLRTYDAAVKLNKFINEFELHGIESFQKFFRATELHSLALKNDSPENQLLNLWVGLETLVPSRLSRNKAKINNVIDSILPFLSLDYIYTLTNKLTLDLKTWNHTSLYKNIKGIDGNDEREKVIKLLILQEYKDKKDNLFADLGDFCLLRNRAHYFSECLNSSSKISKLLSTHWARVDWQIRRIYRTRNQIVHAGRTPRYIDVLIKNTHDYLDVVTNGIVSLASAKGKINTVEQAFKYAEVRYDEYIGMLAKEDIPINISNISDFVIDKRI